MDGHYQPVSTAYARRPSSPELVNTENDDGYLETSQL